MAGMMSSNRNRSVLRVDDPWDGDGFWTLRRFKAKRRTGAATGGRGWRRAIRSKEKLRVEKEIRSEY